MSKVKVEHIVSLTSEVRGPDGELTDRISFRRPVVGDLRVFDDQKGENDAMIRFTAKLSGFPLSSIEAIDMEDWPAVLDKVNGFLKGFGARMKAISAGSSPTSPTDTAGVPGTSATSPAKS